mmetsp:Transcript_28462/g.78408  ORF Transcript_28462/g.78408 Transcript_28462/m.78408 type:complete len:208 (+) Transcript_28462:2559-3182(+)
MGLLVRLVPCELYIVRVHVHHLAERPTPGDAFLLLEVQGRQVQPRQQSVRNRCREGRDHPGAGRVLHAVRRWLLVDRGGLGFHQSPGPPQSDERRRLQGRRPRRMGPLLRDHPYRLGGRVVRRRVGGQSKGSSQVGAFFGNGQKRCSEVRDAARAVPGPYVVAEGLPHRHGAQAKQRGGRLDSHRGFGDNAPANSNKAAEETPRMSE